MNILLAVVVVLGIITLTQLIRVFELTKSLNGTKDNEVTDKENNGIANGFMLYLIGLFSFFIWLVWAYGPFLLPEAASVHGEKIDLLMNFNWAIIITSFAITHILLFYFAFKYKRTKGVKADFVTHNAKLELVWTTVPAIVLAIVIIYGISTWNDIMTDEPEDALTIELFAKQFDWTARYAGEDGVLGKSNYRLISGTNPMGLVTLETIVEKLAELEKKKAKLELKLSNAEPNGTIAENTEEKIRKIDKHFAKVFAYQKEIEMDSNLFLTGHDDIPVKVEFHLPVNKPVKFFIRSRDVLHSVYMPHFRAQMNAVPGMLTSFYFTPNKTTDEMRNITKNPEFDYLLLCNKICGAAHYNMQMNIIVESEEKYNAWLKEQPTFFAEEASVDKELKEIVASN
jgi:cytochrome c oxidase subunit II